MRITKVSNSQKYKIAILDDDSGVVEGISIVLKGYGYNITGFTDPYEAIKNIEKNNYDLLILDYLMISMRGDEVVEEIRKFNKELYILLLTGHKDIAPPLETLTNLDIQGYCEKSSRFDQLILMITSGIKSVIQTRTVNKYQEGLNRILQAVREIYRLRPVSEILEYILRGIMNLVDSTNSFVFVDDVNNVQNGGNKSIYKGIGQYDVHIEEMLSMLTPGFFEAIGCSRNENKVVKLDNGIIFPLIDEKVKSIGVMYVDYNELQDIEELLEIYSRHVAASLSNAFLHSLVNMKNEELNKTYEELKIRYMDTIQILRLTVDAKDKYTRGHSDRVSYYAVRIGEAFGFSSDDLETLRLGGLFHDVGKIATADNILFKTESLEINEYDEVKKHTLKGANMLSAVSMFKKVVPIVKYHHERIDGKGYPEGIKGEEIPFMARILSVADAFDAMTSDRKYRLRLKLGDAVKQLTDAAGTQFDVQVVEKFVELLKDYDTIQKDVKEIEKNAWNNNG